MKILVIDDTKAMLEKTGKVLKEAGYTDTVLCESEKKGLDVLKREKIDVVLIDWQIAGSGAVQKIKKDEKTKTIPVIMLTVEEHPMSIKSTIESGVDGCVVKPVKKEIVTATITRLMAKD